MKKEKITKYSILRRLRMINDITLDEAAKATGMSLGYLNRIERGLIKEIKNDVKRKKVENYIHKLSKLKPKLYK